MFVLVLLISSHGWMSLFISFTPFAASDNLSHCLGDIGWDLLSDSRAHQGGHLRSWLRVSCMLEALAGALLSGELGCGRSDAASSGTLWWLGIHGLVQAGHAGSFWLSRFVQRLLTGHHSLSNFCGQEVVWLGWASLCHDLMVDRLWLIPHLLRVWAVAQKRQL